MDILLYALASLTLQRAFFPRGGWRLAAGMIVASAVPDIDGLSSLLGPRAYLAWHRTYTHSLVGLVVAVLVGVVVTRWLDKKQAIAGKTMWLACAIAVIAHFLLDLGQSDGITLFWPLTKLRFAADLFAGTDVLLLIILIAALAIPELFRLVSSEIGVKDKSPRGRNAALAAFALVVAYAGVRYALHMESMALLDSSSYKGESPRRVASFADPLSPLRWHGVVETQSMLCVAEVPAASSSFNAEAAACQYKPEPSPALNAASKTQVVEQFVQVTRFPHATVEKTETGREVVVRAMRDDAEHEAWHRVAAKVDLDAAGAVRNQELVWSDQVHTR